VGIYPYENTLRAVKISGQQLRDYLEHSARYFRTYEPNQRIINDSVAGYNYDVVSGVVYNVDLSRPAGQRIRGLAYEGRIVQPTDSFTMAVNSYRQAGGGGYSMLANARVVYDKVKTFASCWWTKSAASARSSGVISAAELGDHPDPARAAARAAFAPAAAAVSAADSTLLRVLTTSDLHGQLEARVWDWSQAGRSARGGAEAVARQSRPRLWLHVGAARRRRRNAGNGALECHVRARTIDAMNTLGIDAAAIGNHEFDWSVDTYAPHERSEIPVPLGKHHERPGTARPEWATP